MPSATKKKTPLTEREVASNDKLLDQIEREMMYAGSDCLFLKSLTEKEFEIEWKSYQSRIKKIKALASKLK